MDEMIVHEKPIVALVNGPALGVGCTMLGLADLIIASDMVGIEPYFERALEVG